MYICVYISAKIPESVMREVGDDIYRYMCIYMYLYVYTYIYM